MNMRQFVYSTEPQDKKQYTQTFDAVYTKFARLYDVAVKVLPVWKTWIRQAVPHIQGPRVLEVSFGTGYLLTQYAGEFETFGIDYSQGMVYTAKRNLEDKGVTAAIQRGDVEALPYGNESFDSVVNTMAFTGYPDGMKAMSEMYRVLKKGGKLILIDVNYPKDRNWLGVYLTKTWAHLGDIVRDMDELLKEFELEYTDQEIGGFGSIHLYVSKKT